MNELEAKEILRGMSFGDCMKMWNKSAAYHNMKFFEIREMDESWYWEWLVSELGGFNFVADLLNSRETFNLTDRFFFYDSNGYKFISFSTKQEFIEVIEEDFFINEIMNQE